MKRRLVVRLVGLQAAVLALMTVLAIAALWWSGALATPGPDDTVIAALQAAVGRDGSGRLVLDPTPELARLQSERGLWFVIRDRQGHLVEGGTVPAPFARIGDALDGVGQARLGWNLGDDPQPGARVKWVSSPAGKVQIMTGTGGTVPPGRMLMAVLTHFVTDLLPILVAMAVATLMSTPVVVRRALSGLGAAAAEAGRIDIDQPGTRLSAGAVPAELRPLVDAVNGALARLDEGHERHRRFLADAAHELRTPIAILNTRLESLPPGPDQARLIEDVARLANLADQLLDLQRLSHDRGPMVDVDLVATARRVAADLAPLAIAAGYQIALETEADAVAVAGDASSLERALTNLVQNAVQHGGRRGTIAISVARSGAVTVTDEGPGIPAEQREQIFEPFHRLQSRERGAGLGLSLVREIIRRHHGHVTVLAAPSGGASFRMTVPTRPAINPPVTCNNK